MKGSLGGCAVRALRQGSHHLPQSRHTKSDKALVMSKLISAAVLQGTSGMSPYTGVNFDAKATE